VTSNPDCGIKKVGLFYIQCIRFVKGFFGKFQAIGAEGSGGIF
jgi:hypothetical protein